LTSNSTTASRLDWRLHAYRPDLADERLRGQVQADAFVSGSDARIGARALPLLRRPVPDAPMDSQVLPGEAVRVFDRRDGWAWVQCGHDGYVGYVNSAGLVNGCAEATHRVNVRETVVLSDAKQVCQPIGSLSLGALVRVEEVGERFVRLTSGGYVFRQHLRALPAAESDWVAVAERVLGLPYLWGGRGAGGIDCSGLVQVALAACGIACPRDSDQQAANLGEAVSLDPADWIRGDAIFVPGHVVLDMGDGRVVHAAGFRWCVMIEPRDECLGRLAAQGRSLTAVRRPMTRL
jgi:cell wall-associated NlpC family hydrolase